AMVSYLPDGRPMKFNLASQSARFAGSSFKPMALAAALEQGVSIYSSFSGPSSITITDPKCADNGVLGNPHNYADESGGYMNLIDATAHSVNTIYAQLVEAIGPEAVVRTAHRLGIRSKLQPVCSIGLGTQAINPLEMTSAYATFAARGIHRDPQAFELVRGPGGGVIGKLRAPGVQTVARNTADQVTYALQAVVSRGTGTAAYFGRPAAGKTGTAEDFKDAWFCGYVPQLAACVWIGYPKAEISLYNVEGWSAVFGGSLPAMIWNRFMSQAVAKLPVKEFALPVFGGRTISGSQYYSIAPTYTPAPQTTTQPAAPAPKPAPAPAPPPAPVPSPEPPPPTAPEPLPVQPPSPNPRRPARSRRSASSTAPSAVRSSARSWRTTGDGCAVGARVPPSTRRPAAGQRRARSHRAEDARSSSSSTVPRSCRGWSPTSRRRPRTSTLRAGRSRRRSRWAPKAARFAASSP